ncbi:MAG: TadG family pilus assembly protein [Planctomycetota bacterium]
MTRNTRLSNVRRRGGALIYATVAMPVMFLGAVIAVDGGGLMSTRAQLQSTADAAALSAVSGMSNNAWLNHATNLVLDNANGRFQPTIPADGVTLGFWNPNARTFSKTATGVADEVQAVRVTVEAQSPTYFASLFGFQSTTLTASAVATPKIGFQEDHLYYALLAKDSIYADGTADFDSYDSDERRTFPGSNGSGDREFEGGTNGHITLKSGVEIWGDFYSGPSSVGSIPSNMFKSGGQQGVIDYDIEFVEPVIPGHATDLGSVDVDSGTYTLSGGTYIMSSFDLDRDAKFKTTGDVTIYLTGHAQIDGRVETHDMYPKNLRIVQTANADIDITAPHNTSNEHEMLADLYNPYGKIELDGKVDFYGRIWANDIALKKGSDFFADLAVTRQIKKKGKSAALVK